MNYTKSKDADSSVISVRMNYRPKWEQWFLLTSDRHWDNPDSLWDLQKEHLNLAKERNAGVIDIGDFFCAMQGKWDKRASKQSVRKIHQVDNYLDSLVSTSAEFFKPWSENFLCMGYGNHERSIFKNHETDLLSRFVEKMNDTTGSNILLGGFSGWIKFLFQNEVGGGRCSKNLFYHHGFGKGGAFVSKGSNIATRMATYLPDADIVITGHIHESWLLEIRRERLSKQGKLRFDEQIHLTIPTYKEEYKHTSGSFHMTEGRPPKPIGAWWIRFYNDNGDIRTEILRAK